MPGDTAAPVGVKQSRTTEVVEKIKNTASCERDLIQLAIP
jgi:hypothetical protein